VKVTFWGTRGSLAVAGPDTLRYGGNTACVALEGAGAPLLVLDAGSGIRGLGAAVAADTTSVHILLTHLHMDHIQGLGFFAPLFAPDREIHIWGPPSNMQSLHDRLTRYLSPPLFPVVLRDLPSRLALHDAPTDVPFTIGNLTISASPIIHPGPTLGYRINDGRVTVAYLPDHEPALGSRQFPEPAEWMSGFDLAWQADLLIHDAQYTDAEYEARTGWGHSSVHQAVAFGEAARVKRLALFHHDPSRDDAALDALLEDVGGRAGTASVFGTREGATLDVI